MKKRETKKECREGIKKRTEELIEVNEDETKEEKRGGEQHRT